MEKPNFDFKGKYIVDADIHLITALHIGGTEQGLEIGGMDNPVIKDPIKGVPYIPGSSLKGKMRSLLEWANPMDSAGKTCVVAQLNEQNEKRARLMADYSGESDPREKEKLKKKIDGFEFSVGPCSCAECDVCIVFGVGAEHHEKGKTPGPTRLTVCDAYPGKIQRENGKEVDQVKEWEDHLGEGLYTEIKTENSIDRLTSAANPRSMERVPAGSVFRVRFIYDVYDESDFERFKVLFKGMNLLEDSALGGGGSRGSGRIEFKNISITPRHRSYYLGTEEKSLKEVSSIENKSARDLVIGFNEIWMRTS